MKNIWLTRPQEDSATLAAELLGRGIATLVAPVMTIAHQPLQVPDMLADGIILTSRHAIEAIRKFPDAWKQVPIYCVGASTALAAREAGFLQALDGGGDALSLLEYIAAETQKNAALFYPSAEETQVDLVALLAARNIHVRQDIAYRALAVDRLPEVVTAALREHTLSGVAFFSARAAKTALRLLNGAGLQSACAGLDAYCISLQVAEAAGAHWRSVQVAAQPTKLAMIEAISASPSS
jgi:uroporphyrinogen-III synthase